MRRFFRNLGLFLKHAQAFAWRRRLRGTTFVAITGSVGKTTTKEALVSILATRHKVHTNLPVKNSRLGVTKAILKTRRPHRFAVFEVATTKPGMLAFQSRMLRPEIAIVLAVRQVHRDRLPALEDVAREKAGLLKHQRRRGLALLNGDDPLVRAMAAQARGPVVLFGTSPEFDFWASDVKMTWPTGLGFRIHHGERSVWVQTRLLGQHWLTGSMAAISCAVICGVSFEDAAAAMGTVAPVVGRLQLSELPNGVLFLRDDFNPSLATLDVALSVLAEARAERRVLLVADVDDSGMSTDDRMGYLGRRASETVDYAVFVGDHAERAARAATAAGMAPGTVHAFVELRDASLFLRDQLRRGDVVLLRGADLSNVTRLYYHQMGEIGCWIHDCAKTILCDHCRDLGFVPQAVQRASSGSALPSAGGALRVARQDSGIAD